MKKWTVLIILLVVALVVVPLAWHPGGSTFGGADDQARSAVAQIDPGYRPWFSSIWEPPSTEIASLLFALQAAIGAGAVFFALGYFVGRARGRTQAAGAGSPSSTKSASRRKTANG